MHVLVCNGTTLTSGCCTSSSPCQIGGGVCSSDDQCEGSHKCGTNNCRYFHPNAPTTADCCYGNIIFWRCLWHTSNNVHFPDSTAKCQSGPIATSVTSATLLQTSVGQQPVNITSPNYPSNYISIFVSLAWKLHDYSDCMLSTQKYCQQLNW